MTENSAHSDLTDKQATILEELASLDVHPTVRSLADRLEERTHRSERWTDDEVSGLLRRLEEKGQVVGYTAETGEQRYKLAG